MTKTHEPIVSDDLVSAKLARAVACAATAIALIACGSEADSTHSPVERTARRSTQGGESRPSTLQQLRRDQGGGCASNAVHFAFDSAELDARARDSLSRDLDCLRRSPRLTVTGMADPRGTQEYNMALGERRARAVSRYLEALGLTGVDIHSVGDHMATGADESGWSHDRRADLQQGAR